VERMEQDGEKEQGEKEFKPVKIECKIMIAASCMLIQLKGHIPESVTHGMVQISCQGTTHSLTHLLTHSL